MQNNYQALSFHHVHGENIRLMKNKKIAFRHEGFCRGIAFSDRPVHIGEPVFVKFVEISTNWSGALRIGFTMNDPNTVKSKLPKYACPDLTSINGNWAKAIAERMAKKDSVLYFFVDHNGDVRYGLDNEEHGIFFGGVNTSARLWAVLDVYGNTTAVEFVEPRSTNNIESDSNIIFLPNDRPSFTVGQRIGFHDFHGRNAVLKRNRLVASRKRGSSILSYVFTDRSLNINERLLMKIINIDPQASGTFHYGITSCNPSSLLAEDLPVHPDDLLDRLEYWVIRQDTNVYQLNDVISITINEEGEVQICKNSQAISKFHVDQTQPLWLFFNICGVVSELQIINSSESYESDISERLGNLQVDLPANNSPTNEIPATSDDPNSDKMCVICLDEIADCALYRCGHVCMCYECAQRMWISDSNVQCPICRQPIRDIIKIYT